MSFRSLRNLTRERAGNMSLDDVIAEMNNDCKAECFSDDGDISFDLNDESLPPSPKGTLSNWYEDRNNVFDTNNITQSQVMQQHNQQELVSTPIIKAMTSKNQHHEEKVSTSIKDRLYKIPKKNSALEKRNQYQKTSTPINTRLTKKQNMNDLNNFFPDTSEVRNHQKMDSLLSKKPNGNYSSDVILSNSVDRSGSFDNRNLTPNKIQSLLDLDLVDPSSEHPKYNKGLRSQSAQVAELIQQCQAQADAVTGPTSSQVVLFNPIKIENTKGASGLMPGFSNNHLVKSEVGFFTPQLQSNAVGTRENPRVFSHTTNRRGYNNPRRRGRNFGYNYRGAFNNRGTFKNRFELYTSGYRDYDAPRQESNMIQDDVSRLNANSTMQSLIPTVAAKLQQRGGSLSMNNERMNALVNIMSEICNEPVPKYDFDIQNKIHTMQNKTLLYYGENKTIVTESGEGIEDAVLVVHNTTSKMNERFA